MPDEPVPSAATDPGLDDLERRLAAFESATKRLNRTMAKTVTPRPEPDPAPAAKPGTRRLADDESSASRLRLQQQEISGLRPAVAAQGPQTGALTARARAGGGETPGFTSKFGKPAIAMTPLAPPATPPAAATASQHRLPLLVVAAISLLVALLALATLPRAFPELNQALVWAPSVVVAAPRAGTIVTVPVRVGDQVATGQELLVLGNAAVSAEREGTVARLCVSAGAVVAAGEPLLELADQRELRIVVALPEPEAAAQGERVRVRLLGEDRVLHGAVESVLPPSSSGFWNGVGTPPLRAVIVLDAGLVPPRLGQGARVVVLGTGPLRPLLLALRDTLPW